MFYNANFKFLPHHSSCFAVGVKRGISLHWFHYALSDGFLAQGGRNENRVLVRHTEIERRYLLFIPIPSAPYLWDSKLQSSATKKQKRLKDISTLYKAPTSSANCTVPNSLKLQQSKPLSRTPPSFFFVNRCTFLCLALCPLLWLCPFASPLPPTPSFLFCLPLSFSLLSPS